VIAGLEEDRIAFYLPRRNGNRCLFPPVGKHATECPPFPGPQYWLPRRTSPALASSPHTLTNFSDPSGLLGDMLLNEQHQQEYVYPQTDVISRRSSQGRADTEWDFSCFQSSNGKWVAGLCAIHSCGTGDAALLFGHGGTNSTANLLFAVLKKCEKTKENEMREMMRAARCRCAPISNSPVTCKMVFSCLTSHQTLTTDACAIHSAQQCPERYDYVELSRIVEMHSRTTLMIMSFFLSFSVC
jgi:hypothetical protein